MECIIAELDDPSRNEGIDDDMLSDDAVPHEVDNTMQQEHADNFVSHDGGSTRNIDAENIIDKDPVRDTVPQPTTHDTPAPQPVDMQDAPKDVDAYRNGYTPNDDIEDGGPVGKTAYQARKHPVEVVLYPPSDPDAYQYIPKSKRMLRILEEVESDDEIYYEVEFTDGRIREVSIWVDAEYYTCWLSYLPTCGKCQVLFGYLEFLILNNIMVLPGPTNTAQPSRMCKRAFRKAPSLSRLPTSFPKSPRAPIRIKHWILRY